MGGLRKKMPITFWTFLIGGLALSGFPIVTAGFWSKDEILGEAWKHYQLVFALLVFAAFMTAFYTMRQITLTFLGAPRTEEAKHAHETPWTMTAPLAASKPAAMAAVWPKLRRKRITRTCRSRLAMSRSRPKEPSLEPSSTRSSS